MPEIRNFIGYGNNPPQFTWENNSKLAIQFVLNYEEGGENTVLNGDEHSEIFLSEIIGAQPVIGERHMNMESIYEYGSRAGFWRIHNEFTERGLPLTIFGVGLALEKNNEVCEAVKKAQFEVASHGYRWIDYQHVDPKIEEQHIIKCNETIKNIFGYYPSGWYTGRTSPNTRDLVLKNTQVLYDSDAYNDDLPYWLNVNKKKHLVIPYALDTNDVHFKLASGLGRATMLARQSGKYLSTMEKAKRIGKGSLGTGVSDALFVGDVEGAGTFGDFMGGPTQLDRDSDSPYAEILNRIKFGTEGVGFAGLIGGIIVVFSIEFIDKVLKIDDAVGAASAHGVAGAWGTLVIGLWGVDGATGIGIFNGGGAGQLGIQAIGVLAYGVWATVTALIGFGILKSTLGLRVSEEVEINGLDTEEHGIGGFEGGGFEAWLKEKK